MAFAAGQRVGDYEILDILGTGGMGRVYRVRNVISDRVEAMKILLPDYASDPELANRFMAEIRTLAGLEHPNIAQLRTAFQCENQLVMVMEFVEGSTLDQVATQSRVPEAQVVEYGMQVLSALSYAHSRGVIHRDIKPSNIMVTSHGLAKIMDFGIAKSTTDLQLTRPGTTIGSVYYMSPEQVRGGTADARSDIYSFGITLYEMFTGCRPFQADTSFTVLNAQLNEKPKPPIELNPSLSPALNSIILCAMEKDPEKRFQSAEAFRNALKSTQGAPREAADTADLYRPAPQASAGSAAPGQVQPAQPLQGFAPPVVISGAQTNTRSHRGLWVAAGAAAALAALAAAALLLPHVFSTHAGQRAQSIADAGPPKATASATTIKPATAPTPESAQAQDTSATQANGSPTDAAANGPSPAQPSVPPPPADTNPATKPSDSLSKSKGVHSASPPEKKSYTSVSAPEALTSQSEEPGPAQPPAPAGPSPAEVRTSRDRLANLDARAQAVKGGVQSIRAQQQAQGLDLRGDILAALSRLNNDLNEASTAQSQNDLTAADEYMDRADKELAILEKFLGR